MSRLLDYIVDAVRSPREQLSRGQHFVRHSWELTAHCWRQLRRHRAAGMAAELTYRTIFALIPVVVLGLVLFRVVGGLEEVHHKVENQLYSFFGVPEIPPDYLEPSREAAVDDGVATDVEVAADVGSTNENAPEADSRNPDDGDDSVTDVNQPEVVDLEVAISVSEQVRAEAQEETRREARASIRRTLRAVTAKVASVDFKSIGVFGLLLFVYAAVALADSAEHLFNRVYDAPSQRPVHLRLAIHWSIITLGSGLLAMSLYMSGQVVDWFAELGAGSTSKLILSHLLAMAASWVLLFLLYALMPNTKVSVRAAATGALVGAILWEAAKFSFQIYVVKAVPYSAIYGSIGLIPLFLFWIYVTWLIVLFGLILTYTLQSLGGRTMRRADFHEEDFSSGDPDWMLPIMSEVGHAFDNGRTLTNQELGDRIGLSGRIVHEMTDKLIEANLLRQVSSSGEGEDGLTLARPSEKIPITEILELAHRERPTSDHPAWRTLASLKLAERSAAKGKSLADVRVE